MSTLDDKILGEKSHYYCSSSEDEDDSRESGEDSKNENLREPFQYIRPAGSRNLDRISTNTGPKGVIKDWELFKQLESEKQKELEREKLELIKKMSLTCESELDEKKPMEEEEEELDAAFEGILTDKVLDDFLQMKIREALVAVKQPGPRYGSYKTLQNGQEFLDVIDNAPHFVVTVIHIYKEGRKECQTMNLCLQQLAKKYVNVQFCCLEAACAGMSYRFIRNGVPALLAYQEGLLIGNYVRLTDEFGDSFDASDIEDFLIEHVLIPDHRHIPPLMKPKDESESDDSD